MKKGINASPGIAVGKVFLYEKHDLIVEKKMISDIDSEKAFFNDTLKICRDEIETLYQKTLAELGEDKAEIFQAHLMVAEDPEFSKKVTEDIEKGQCAPWAVQNAINTFSEMFLALEDDYFRERAADIQDVGNRVLRHLLHLTDQDISDLPADTIIIAKDLAPSDTAQMDKDHIIAFATDIGGKTSHTAIMARSLEIPAVLGLKDISSSVTNGETIIVDGIKGEVILHPDADQIDSYLQKQTDYRNHVAALKALKNEPAQTLDGHQVVLAGNIGSPDDVTGVLDNGGQSVGLYRTEFLFMNCETMPNESTQFNAYKKVIEAFNGRDVIIRTLDIGGDKTIPYLPMDPEMNPFLGLRAIRLCFKEKELFKTQLRAILRASVYGQAKIMFPMISCVDEVIQAKGILEECKAELDREGLPYDAGIQVGVMIEIPSAALTADIIAAEVDFFSIGTNDLCQYTLAVDRMNTNVSYLYDPLHPAILRLVKNVIDASHAYPGKFTGMCGEMAGDPQAALILLGLGLDEFSMSAAAIPQVKSIIRKVTFSKAREIAAEALCLNSSEAIRKLIQSEMSEMANQYL